MFRDVCPSARADQVSPVMVDFPMIGKNGEKSSNDWKNGRKKFQRLENVKGPSFSSMCGENEI
jgi:hypothetical protein